MGTFLELLVGNTLTRLVLFPAVADRMGAVPTSALPAVTPAAVPAAAIRPPRSTVRRSTSS